MTEITISASDLQRALHNALLFIDKDDSFQDIRIRIGETLEITGASRYGIVKTTKAPAGHQEGSAEIFVSIEGAYLKSPAEKFEKAVRDNVKQDACLEFDGQSLSIRDTDISVETVEKSTELWDKVDGLLIPTKPVVDDDHWTINPERLGALNRLKFTGKYPADLYRRSAYGVHAKVGPDIRILFAPIQREIAMQHFKDKGDDVAQLFWTEEDFAA